MAWQVELPERITRGLKISQTYRGLNCWAFVPGCGFLQVRCTTHPVSYEKKDSLSGRVRLPRVLVLWQQVCVPGGSPWHGSGVPSTIDVQQWEHQEDQMDPLFWVDPAEYKPPKKIRQPITMKH